MKTRKACLSVVLIMALSSGFALSAWGYTITLKNGMAQADGNVRNAIVSCSGAAAHTFGEIHSGQADSFRADNADWQGKELRWNNLEVWTNWPTSYGCPAGAKQTYPIYRSGNITIVIKKDGCNYSFTRE